MRPGLALSLPPAQVFGPGAFGLHKPQPRTLARKKDQDRAVQLKSEENARAEIHLRIGNLLAASFSQEKREEAVFEIVNQLNRGSHLITSAEERKRVGALNLVAGKRAKSSTAYVSALLYLRAARALLTEQSWDEDHELIFSVECDTAECEFLTADMESAENRLAMLAQRTKGARDIAVVTRLRMALYTTMDRRDHALEIGVAQLRRFGIEWSTHPGEEELVLDAFRALRHRVPDLLLLAPRHIERSDDVAALLTH